MLQKDPALRISAADALKHQFFDRDSFEASDLMANEMSADGAEIDPKI